MPRLRPSKRNRSCRRHTSVQGLPHRDPAWQSLSSDADSTGLSLYAARRTFDAPMPRSIWPLLSMLWGRVCRSLNRSYCLHGYVGKQLEFQIMFDWLHNELAPFCSVQIPARRREGYPPRFALNYLRCLLRWQRVNMASVCSLLVNSSNDRCGCMQLSLRLIRAMF